jgi:hypothetical protein
MSYKVVIRRVTDGVERVCEVPTDWEFPSELGSGDIFDWEEGNRSCDCNRGQMFEGDRGVSACGESLYRVLRFELPDGTVIPGPDSFVWSK